MNRERLHIMATILDEAHVGTWRATQIPGYGSDVSSSFLEGWQEIFENPVGFHLGTWGGEDYSDAYTDYHHCGFTACAVGHAILDERLPQLITRDYDFDLVPMYGDETQWAAVASFFGITEEQANHLFSEQAYPPYNADEDEEHRAVSPNEVAIRIHQLLAEDPAHAEV